MASTEIEIQDLVLNFNRELVLDHINLQIQKGEIFVIVGPSGLGKSVLIKIMAGILKPTEGQVLIRGENLYAASLTRQREILKSMGMLFQKNALFDSLTCAENIAFPLREVTTMSEQDIAVKSQHFLSAVGLVESAHLYPDEISGGMQKRLGIARALALDPGIIYYDDPTAGLDPITSRKIIDLILETQRAKQSTVIAITNDMNRAYQMADRIAVVFSRDFVLTGTPEETRRHADPRVQQFIKGLLDGPLTDSA